MNDSPEHPIPEAQPAAEEAAPAPPKPRRATALDNALAVVNGAVGDYLDRTGNGLATTMSFAHEGRPLDAAGVVKTLVSPSARCVVLLHGLMCTEDIWRMKDGSDYGSRLATDAGLTPLYVRYNTGRAIPDNGASLDALLTALVPLWPVALEEIVLLGYSMGGLVARSACHVAGLGDHAWLGLVKRAVYVGTPHLGAPMERVGRVVSKVLRAVDDPYTRLLADLADLRSDGVKDLGDADLTHGTRALRVARASLRSPQHPIPLLPSIRHRLIAGTLFGDPNLAALFGDSIVPLPSATDGAAPLRADAPMLPDDVKIVTGLSHLDIPHDPAVYEHVKSFLTQETR